MPSSPGRPLATSPPSTTSTCLGLPAIFVDTTALVARHIQRDQHHERARRIWRRLAESGEPCATSNHVLDETINLLERWTTCEFAAERARVLLGSSSLQILRSDARDELQAVALLERYADQQVSFTDCLSFVLMRRHGIQRAFTFDRHFAVAGFQIVS